MNQLFIKKTELEKAQNNADQMNNFFNDTQYEVKREKIVAGERVGWFSAAAISLSFTLIGYLFSNDGAKKILAEEVFWNISLIIFLIVGWISLSLSVLGSLLIRLWNALHLNYNTAYQWSSKNREFKEKALEAVEVGVDFLFTDAKSTEQAIHNIEESKNNYLTLEKDFKTRSNTWLKALNYGQAFIYVGAICGLTLLSMFLILVTYKLVFS